MRVIDDVSQFEVFYHDKLFWNGSNSAEHVMDLFTDETDINKQRAIARIDLWNMLAPVESNYDKASEKGLEEIHLTFETALDLELTMFIQPLIEQGVIDEHGKPTSQTLLAHPRGIPTPTGD